jgi:RHS repeat-associated protein
MVMPNGTTTAMSSLSVRATEVTVGPNGPMAMPATLPADSAYTFAAEFSADEALSAGATTVLFSQPIYQYVENFLNFPVGTAVPVGYYDRVQTKWLPLPNGRVIKILSITAGAAKIDVDGNGVVATPSELTTLGVSAAELQQLAALYKAGQSLWRTPLPHFTLVDDNFPTDANHHDDNTPAPNTPDKSQCCAACGCTAQTNAGSTISQDTQTLHENLSIAGTPYFLNYSSDRARDRRAAYTIHIPLTGSDVTDLVGVKLNVSVAGEIFSQTFTPSANLSYDYVWDGKDAYGNVVWGPVNANIEIDHSVAVSYGLPAANPSAFGLPASGTTSVPARTVLTGHRFFVMPLGAWDSRSVGLGSWTVNVNHAFDPVTHTVFYGDGSKSLSQPEGFVAGVFAGSGVGGNGGDGGQALAASFGNTNGLAQAQDGSIYVASTDHIRKIDPTGIVSTYAGGGVSTADGVTALQASISYLQSLAINPVDGALYYTDFNANKIRKISTLGIVTTVASAPSPLDLTISADGIVYYSSSTQAGVFRVLPDNTSLLEPGSDIFGSVAKLVYSFSARALFMGGGGHLIERRAGFADVDYSGLAGVNQISRLSADGVGGVVFSTYVGNFYRYISGTSFVIPLSQPLTGNAQLLPQNDGSVLVTAPGQHQILKITPKFTGFNTGGYQIASPDGSETYLFDAYGKHVQTLDLLGHTEYTFAYGSYNQLTSITDRSGNITTFNNGRISSPYGVTSYYNITSTNYLGQFWDPAGHSYKMSYSGAQASLLSEFDQPSGAVAKIVYDSFGRVSTDQDGVGAVHSYVRTDLTSDGTNYQVVHTSPMGNTETHTFGLLSDGRQDITTSPSGFNSTITNMSSDGSSSTSSPDGTVSTLKPAADLRFGFQSSYLSSSTTTVPAVIISGSVSPALTDVVTQTQSIVYPNGTFFPYVMTKSSSINGNTSVSVLDTAQSQQITTSAVGRVSSVNFDPTSGLQSQVDQPGLLPVNFSYDAHGRLSQLVQGTRATQFGYDSMGYLANKSNALGQTTLYVNDLLGRPTQTTLPDGRVIGMTYDTSGNVTSISPPGRPATLMGFSLVDLMTLFNPGGGGAPTAYAYTSDRRPASLTNPDGSSAKYQYDSTTGALSQVITPDGATTYSHLASGQVGVITNPTSTGTTETMTMAWQGFLPSSTVWSGETAGSVTWTYDNSFRPRVRIASIAIPGSPNIGVGSAYFYDADGLFLGHGVMRLNRNATTGLVMSAKFTDSLSLTGPALNDTFGYDSYGAVTSYDVRTNSGAGYYSYQISRDNLGRISGKNETVNGVLHGYGYVYDKAGRLTNVYQDGVLSSSYAYDSNSNRVGSMSAISGSQTLVYNTLDQLVSRGSVTYTYDPNGRRVSKVDSSTNQTTTYRYNVFGNLVGVTLPTGQVIDYVLDGISRRVGKKVSGVLTETYIYLDELRMAAKANRANGSTQVFIYPNKGNVPEVIFNFSASISANAYRVMVDERGTPKLVEKASDGSILEQITTDEFGNTLSDTNPGLIPFGFAGCFLDQDTKLCHFGAREYDASVGRWLSKDPILFNGGDTNLYGYTLNDPINRIDPTGHNSWIFLENFADMIRNVNGLISTNVGLETNISNRQRDQNTCSVASANDGTAQRNTQIQGRMDTNAARINNLMALPLTNPLEFFFQRNFVNDGAGRPYY